MISRNTSGWKTYQLKEDEDLNINFNLSEVTQAADSEKTPRTSNPIISYADRQDDKSEEALETTLSNSKRISSQENVNLEADHWITVGTNYSKVKSLVVKSLSRTPLRRFLLYFTVMVILMIVACESNLAY